MIDLAADHIGFVVAAYGVVVAVLGVLVFAAVLKARRLKRALVTKGLADPGERDARR
jgi:heme exporter protein CcmD